MKKVLTAFLLTVAFSSCNSYLDRGQNVHNDLVDFTYSENYNQFIYKSNLNSIADKEVFYPTHFSVNLPKKIISWQSLSNEFFFEYCSKEIIYINAGYKNKGDAGKWVVKETNDDEIYSMLISYWNKKKYNENTLMNLQLDRISNVYTDGKVSILLYNIKQENFEKYLNFVKSFKYLD